MTRSISRPIQLAGFAGRLARAEKLEQDLEVTGDRYDRVLEEIDDQKKALAAHVGSLEETRAALDRVIDRMAPGSNGGPNDGETSQSGSEVGQGVGQVITSRTDSEV